MDKNIVKQFPATGYSWNQWYSAKYGGSSKRFSKALRTVFETLEGTDQLRPFLTDFCKNIPVIKEEHESPGTYDNSDGKIEIAEHHLVTDFAGFRNWKKTRYMFAGKVIPTYSAIITEEVQVEIDGPKFTVMKPESKEKVTVKKMEEVITSHAEMKQEKAVFYTDRLDVLVSELAGKPVEAIKDKEPSRVSVEDQCSADIVVNFINNFKKSAVKVKYVEQLRNSFKSAKNELPIPRETEDKMEFVSLNLPVLHKNFMNPTQLVHNQDIARTLMEKEKIEISEKSMVEQENDFKVEMEKKPEQQPPKIMVSQTWLDTTPFESYSVYCPIYTGLKATPWLLRKYDDFPFCKNKETYKLLISLMVKFSKFYALWIRANLSGKDLKLYVEKVLKFQETSIYGFTVFKNMSYWTTPIVIKRFKEKSAYTIKEDTGMFGDGDVDFTNIFQDENYDPPDFDMGVRNKIQDRDKGELNEEVKQKRGSNNDDQRAFQSGDKANLKTSKSQSKKKDDSDSSSNSSEKVKKKGKQKKKQGKDSSENEIPKEWDPNYKSKKKRVIESSSTSGSDDDSGQDRKKKKKVSNEKSVKKKANDKKAQSTSKVKNKTSDEVDIPDGMFEE